MGYTINQLATLAGVSVRTLHHYDAIGLLKPSHLLPNGYRQYEEAEWLRLQQILFFRELEFPLDDIKRIIQAPTYSTVAALREQKKMFKLKQQRLEQLIKSIDKTIKTMTQQKPIEA